MRLLREEGLKTVACCFTPVNQGKVREVRTQKKAKFIDLFRIPLF